MYRQKKRFGFTLIELMLCITIIGMMIAVTMPVFVRSRYSAQLTSCQLNLRAMAAAMENFHTDYDKYPELGDWENQLISPDPPYISRIPLCPQGNTSYTYERDDVGHNFTFSCNDGMHHLVLEHVHEGYPKYGPQAGLQLAPGEE